MAVIRPLVTNPLRRLDAKTNLINQLTLQDYLIRLENLAISMFEWENLPDSIEEHFLEQTLCELGYSLYFRDDVFGDCALPCTLGPGLNIYNVPVRRRAYATNGYNYEADDTNSVLIYNNYMHTPTIDTIALFARRLYEIERTIDVNVKAQKTPVLIAYDEEKGLTLRNIYEQYEGNKPVIFAGKNILTDTIKVFKTDAPFVAADLQILKRQIWNEFLTFIGVENSNTEKRERLVTDEITSNLGGVEAQRYVMLVARQEAAKKINKMFGTDIRINFRQDWSGVLGEDLWHGDEDGATHNPENGGGDNG